MSSPTSTYSLEPHYSCMDADENTYVGGRISGSGVQGLLVKITYDGSIDWVMQNSAFTASYHTGIYNLACNIPNFVYGFGDSGDASIANAVGRYVFYFVKFHSSMKLVYAKNVFTSGVANTDYNAGGDVSPDGQYIYIIMRSRVLVSGTENSRAVKFKASDGSMIMAKGTSSGGIESQSYQGIQVSGDGKYIFYPHYIQNAFGIAGTAQQSGALMKLDQNLDIVWYYYTSSANSPGDRLEYITYLQDGSVVTGGCYTSSIYVQSSEGNCDVTIFKVNENGAMQWGWTLGGSSTERLYTLTSSHNSQVIYAGGSVSSSTLIATAGNGEDMFISSHLASDGSLIAFKILGGTGSDQVQGLSVSKMGHLSIVARSTTTSPFRMSYSSQVSFVFQKLDTSLADSDCWATKAASFTNIKTVLTAQWTKITNAVMVPHSQVASNDRTSAFIFQAWTRNTDYFLFSFCSTPTSIPQISDKYIYFGMDVSLDIDDDYSIDNLCFVNQVKTWTSATLFDGTTLPTGFTFDSATQTFKGKISTAGIYYIKMIYTQTSPDYQANSLFYIYVENDAPTIKSSISDQNLTVGKLWTFTISNVNTYFTEPNSEQMTLNAFSSDYNILPSWLRFFPANNTFVGYPTYEQKIRVALVCYDPQKSNTTLFFNINVTNNAPIVINQPKDICVYQDTNANLRYELPQLFNDSDSQQLSISLIPISGTCPAFVKFQENGMVIFQDLATAQTVGQCTVQLTATDGTYQVKTQFKIVSQATTPKINSATNTSCANWVTYQYLDNEIEGQYFMNFISCFIPTSYKYSFNATFSDESIIPFDIIRMNATTGELRINALQKYAGKYLVKLTAKESLCAYKISMFVVIIINMPPKANNLVMDLQVIYLYEDFYYQVPDDWFTDSDDSQTLQVTATWPNTDEYVWLTYLDGFKKTLKGRPTFNGNFSIIFTATDNYGQSVYSVLLIEVLDNSKPLTYNSDTLSYTVSEGDLFSINLPQSFYDPDPQDTIAYSLIQNTRNQSTWAKFNPVTQSLNGQAPNTNSTSPYVIYNFGFIAQDTKATNNRKNIILNVTQNYPPKFLTDVQNLTFMFGQFGQYQFPKDLAFDLENQRNLTIFVKQLINNSYSDQYTIRGLVYYQNNRTLISNFPKYYQDLGTYQFAFQATDNINQSAIQKFTITISANNVNDMSDNYYKLYIIIGLFFSGVFIASIVMQVQTYKAAMKEKEKRKQQYLIDNNIEVENQLQEQEDIQNEQHQSEVAQKEGEVRNK
eukprot:403338291